MKRLASAWLISSVMLTGCMSQILEVRKQMMMESLLFCGSQYDFFAGQGRSV